MSGRSGRDRAIGGRLLAAAALVTVAFVGLALVWGGPAPARAQDQAKWWGGAANIDPCPAGALDLLIDRIARKDTKAAYPQCNIHTPAGHSKDEKRARFSVLYGLDGQDKVTITVSAIERLCSAHGCYWGSTEGWGVMSCDDAEQIKGDVLKAIKYPLAAGPASCSAYSNLREGRQSINITFEPKTAPQQTCDKSVFLGGWKNDNAKYARYAGAALTFEKSMRAGEVMGRFRLQKESHNTQFILGNVIETAGPPQGCLFPANLDSSMQMREALKYDKATDSFTITEADGSPNSSFPGRWTRGAPAKAAATCGKDDINGTWHRADGARILMSGVGVFGGGGHAIMERYPEDRWPKGELKFRGVKEVSQCRYEASCTTINRRTTNGVASYGVTEAACTLTLDPQKRTLSATGGSGLFTRVAPAAGPSASEAKAEAEAAKKREADAEAARTAALNRAIAERDAEIQRRNAAAKAADERRQAEYRAAVARQQAEAERLRREDAAAKARYEQEMAAWRAKVEACKAGNTAQCQ